MEKPGDTHNTGQSAQLHRHAAIMFTDIVGYTALMGSDEDEAFAILKKNQKIHNELIGKFNGTLIKEVGDGMLISFDLASDAVRCAIELQKACKEQGIPLKIGIDEGETIFEKGDVLGDSVNIASRLQSITPVEGIYISETVNRNIENKKGIDTRFVKQETLRNVKHPVRIYQVEIGVLVKSASLKNKKRTLYYLLGGLLIIAVLITARYLIPKSPTVELERSIAVLPFKSLSEDPEKQYLADGVMDAILLHLSKIQDLRVLSRTSVENYRNPTKTISRIASELEVNYILEGSFQKIGNQVKLIVQLINASQTKEMHVWSEEYNRNMSDIFSVQSEVAQSIARELHAAITPEAKARIDIVPTRDLTAYDYFLRGREVYQQYLDERDTILYNHAVSLFNKSLEYDSSFAQAYTSLAVAYWNKNYVDTFYEEDFMDTVLVLANKALSYNNQLEEAYYVIGLYYFGKGLFEKALENNKKAIQINPNYSLPYKSNGWIYAIYLDNCVNGLSNMHQAARLDHSSWLIDYYYRLGLIYGNIGFDEKARFYLQKKLILDNDSIQYFNSLAWGVLLFYSPQEEINLNLRIIDKDPTFFWALKNLEILYSFLGNYEEAYKMHQKAMDSAEGNLTLGVDHRSAYVLWQIGKREEAKLFFEKGIRDNLESIRLNRVPAKKFESHYDLAAIYSFLGEKEKAFTYLKQVESKYSFPRWWVLLIKIDPLLDNIRDDPRFKAFQKQAEEKYQAEHERVKVWLEAEGML